MRRPRPALARGLLLIALATCLLVPGSVGASPARPPGAPASAHERTLGAPTMHVPTVRLTPHPSAGFPSYDWGTAFFYYLPTDDTTHFLGEGAAMVVDNKLHNMTVFGGEARGGLTNLTVDYNYTNGSFFLNALNPAPSARTNASFADVPGRDFAVLFGGLTNLTTQRSTNDTWIYFYANQTWRNVTHGAAPPDREAAAFAVNGSGATALLEGGVDPAYSTNGSSALVFWNDTWSLNLTTFNWTHLHPRSSPPPLYASGMIWQNATDRYLLFGGCAISCSSSLWSFGGSPGRWTKHSNATGPTGRGGMAFVWDGPQGTAIAFGGFNWGGSGSATPLGDGWLYSAARDVWGPVTATGGPFPVFDAPNVWGQFAGCVGLVIMGGSITLAGPPQTASVLQPLNSVQPNCFPYLISGSSNPPPPPCAGNHSSLALQVVDAITGAGVPSASVDLEGGCIHQPETTDAHGWLNLTLPAPDLINITAIATGYRPNEVQHVFAPNATVQVTLPLNPLPSLHVRTWQLGTSGVPTFLGGVQVQEGSLLTLGTTDPAGWLNVSRITAPIGNLTLYGVLANHSRASTIAVVPAVGPFSANLTLDDAGFLDVQVVDASSGTGVTGALGILTNLDPGAPRPVAFTAGAGGWYNVSVLAAANYSVAANFTGYFTNHTRFFHPWIAPQVVVVPLIAKPGATLDAFVRNAATGVPIGGANVSILGFGSNLTLASGWANFTNVKPAGPFEIVAKADGYATNYSWTLLDYGQVADPYVIALQPVSPCPGHATPQGCTTPFGSTGAPFGYLNGGTGVLYLLVATPAVLLGAALAFGWIGRQRPPEVPPRSRTSPAERRP